MNLFNFAGIIGDAIADVWMSIWLSLNNLIYNIIEILYRVFETVANINLFSDSIYDEITSRIYVVMGIAMLFIMAYNLILMIINPDDKKGTGQMTKMIKEIIISLILIVLLPRVFSYMSILQKHILDSNILGQIIIGDSGGTTPTCNYDEYTLLDQYQIQNVSGGTASVELNNDCNEYNNLSPGVKGAYSIAPTLFEAFYHPTNYGFTQCKEYMDTCKNDTSCTTDTISEDEDKKMCTYYFHDVSKAVYIGSLKPFNEDSEFYSKVKNNSDDFEFNYLLAFVAGCFAVYMFVCYTLAIGVRVAKLGFLQILSPIAVMMRIIPKQKEAIFDKWLKQLTNAYLDVFIRLAIIYFALFAISLVPGVIDNLAVETDGTTVIGNFVIWLLAKVILILGILKFAQDAPALLKEFFSFSGQFALKSPVKQFTENKLAMKGLGAVTGGIGSSVVGFSRNFHQKKDEERTRGERIFSGVGGAISGLTRGSVAGYKNGLDKTKQTISDTADTVQQNRGKFKAIPNNIKNKATKTKENFIEFMQGDVASAELGKVANTLMVNVENQENDFSNASISQIKEGRTNIMKKFNSDEDFDFNGRKYHKIDANNWRDDTGRTITHKDLGTEISDSYKDRLARAYAQNEMKAGIKEGFERANAQLLKELREALPKLGDNFSTSLWDKLNGLKDVDGVDMNLDVHSIDELEDRVKRLMESEAGRSSIYKINDEIKSAAKGVKISNDQAMKAQQANKEKKDNSGK